MLLNRVIGARGLVIDVEGGYEKHFGQERQYLSFTYRIKHNKGIFIKYQRAHRLLNITDNIGHS